jgi:hypothetical protein
MSSNKKNLSKIQTKSVRHNEVVLKFKNGKTLKGWPIPGFEFLDNYRVVYDDPKTGLKLPFILSAGIAPPGFGDHFKNGVVERAGVIVGKRVRYGLPKELSPQTSMRRAQYYIKYAGSDWTPEMVNRADKLLGVAHNKSIQSPVKLEPHFFEFLKGIIGPAFIKQDSLTEKPNTDRNFTTDSVKKVLKKMGRKFKFKIEEEIEVEKKDQNKSKNPKPRAKKRKGIGSHSRGKEKITVPNFGGKFNVRNERLGPEYPPYDYEKDGKQIVIILNEDDPQIKAILDHNLATGFADKDCPIFESTMMRAGQFAVNRETGKMSQDEWERYVELHGGLSTELDLVSLEEIKKAI